MKSFIGIASFALAASAAVIDERAAVCIGCITDTDPTALDEVLDDVPLLEQIGLGFLAGTDLSAVTPASGDHVAASGALEGLTQIGNVTLKPFGTIAADPTKGVRSFDADSFYFSCAVDDANSLVTPATGCTISVTGFYLTGVQTQTLRFTISPTSILAAQMERVDLPFYWLYLKNLTIGVAESDVFDALTIIDIDNFRHRNHA
ncbi:Hypothetical predicted protein [Lecanosticta acicola]|uniref:Secreted protein n=1 Tax=Lecanosticta acicola TaxID=111012 RepID=A0AAI8YSR6_9PEZI|nr:Hypothetical predicted protein [Lecanosticta acicola]